MPGAKQSMILVGTRLTEVRGFSDFFSEFFTALRKTQFPPNMRMVVLCNRPNYELRAFQVLLIFPMHVQPKAFMQALMLIELRHILLCSRSSDAVCQNFYHIYHGPACTFIIRYSFYGDPYGPS